MKLLKRMEEVANKAVTLSIVGAMGVASFTVPTVAATTKTSTKAVTNMQLTTKVATDEETTELPDSTVVGEQPPELPEGVLPGEVPPAKPGEGGFDVESGSSVETTGVYVVDTTQTISNEEITATDSNQSPIKVTSGGILTLKDATLNKASGEMTVEEASDFFGANAGILVNGGATANISNVAIKTTASGGNAVFSTGEGTIVNISNASITTTKDHSRGLDATYNGTINASNISIQTAGAHCAAVATDRGEGTVTVKDSKLNTTGDGSPCVYSTGNITVTNSQGTATGSMIAGIEGKNSITLDTVNFTGYAIGRGNGGGCDDVGVMIYQSMSGDANNGTGTFTAKNSTLTIAKDSKTYATAPMFFVTNTEGVINLTSTTLNFGSGILVKASGNEDGWGKTGENGADLQFNASQQTLKGNVICDAISTIDMKLQESTNFTGAVNHENTGNVTVVLDSNSKWNVTANSYVSVFTDEDETLTNITSNGYNIYYDAANEANAWLNGETIILAGGGMLTPIA
nr:hypothetical protein [uncultured Cellulosilyticum sp.]